MRNHELKIWPQYFEAVESGAKPFEIRNTEDRTFDVGDVLKLREWDPKTEDYTGRETRRTVSYVLSDGVIWNWKPCAILGLEKLIDSEEGEWWGAVSRCARCGGDHKAILWRNFTNRPEGITHWGTCPKLGEPILMTVSPDADTKLEEGVFFLRSVKHDYAGAEWVLWWRPESKGYTYDIQAAGRYTQKEANEIILDLSPGDTVAVPVADVLPLASTRFEKCKLSKLPGNNSTTSKSRVKP